MIKTVILQFSQWANIQNLISKGETAKFCLHKIFELIKA